MQNYTNLSEKPRESLAILCCSEQPVIRPICTRNSKKLFRLRENKKRLRVFPQTPARFLQHTIIKIRKEKYRSLKRNYYICPNTLKRTK